MKKRDLLSLAMLGLCASLTIGACQAPANNYQKGPNYANGDVDQNFYNSLSPENQRRFDQLDARGRAAVLQFYRDGGSRDANRALDTHMRNHRSRTGQVETKEKAEVAATSAAPATVTAPVENKATTAVPVEAEKVENKVSSATSTATTTVQ